MLSVGKKAAVARRTVNWSLTVNLLLVACAWMACGPMHGQTPNAGWVANLKGEWTVGGGKTLNQADPVPAGGQLANRAPKDGDFIDISDLHGDLQKSIRCTSGGCGECTGQNQCNAPIEPLPQAPGQPGVFSAAMEVIRELLVGQPERYSVHRSRSIAGEPCTAENVVPLDAEGHPRLDRIMKDCAGGTYTIDFAPLDRHASQATKETTLHWNRSSASEETPVALAPGLYDVTVSGENHSGDTWMLVCAPSSFEKESADFDQFVRVIDGWRTQLSKDSIVPLKRAYLDSLTRQKGGAH